MRVAVLGINHKLADLSLRDAIAKAFRKKFSYSHLYDFSFVTILTCNRIEIYFSSTDLAKSQSQIIELLRQEVDEEFEQKLYSFFGHHCFLHLTRVAAGLDSAIIGETAVQGQVKDCYEEAKK